MPTSSEIAIREKPSKRVSSWFLWIGVVIWIVAPVLIVAVVVLQNRTAEFATATPAWAPVSAPTARATDDADIAMKWDPGVQILAPAWHGVVQSVQVQTGEAVADGTTIATVDGVRRIAWHTPGAFYRPLALGDTGEDVSWLKSILRAQGSVLAETDRFDWATLVAVRSFAADLGVSASSYIRTFDHTWVVYLPAAIPSLQSVSLAGGAPALSAGSVVATGSPVLVEATVVARSSSSDSAGSEQGSAEQAAIQYANRTVADPVDVEPGDELIYAGAPLAWDEVPPRLDSASLASLAEKLAPKTGSVPAQLFRSATDGELEVPSAAITASPTPVICARHGDVVREVEVNIQSDKWGVTRIVANIAEGTEVRVPGPSATFPCRSDSSD